MDYKPLPIGIEDFEEIINLDYYYVDKTLFIKELLDKKGKVNLFTRPRRFGKSLTVSMLQNFFEKGKNEAQLFKGLKIMDAGDKYVSEMNKYPVIKLTFKSVGQLSYEDALDELIRVLIKEFKRHRYLLKSHRMEEEDRILYKEIISGTAKRMMYSGSLQFLSECLEQYYEEKVVVLIDEYDVPLEKSYFNGYYREMLDFIRLLFDNVLKTNDSLHFAVLTGCLRVSKESIFTGLNHLDEISITSNHYDEYFGFTEEEVAEALTAYQLDSKAEEIRRWYNGFVFGQKNIYNPWSIIKCLKDLYENINWLPRAYWSNTSSNDIIRYLIEVSDNKTKGAIESLIRGRGITIPIHEDIVYNDIKKSEDNLWNFLFFTGYLKKTSESLVGRQIYFTLKIPNEEIQYIYENQIREWFNEKVKIADATFLLDAIVEGDTDTITKELNKRLMDMISFLDSAENFYHGFLLGILSNVKGYVIKSNRESGEGRSDIFMKARGLSKKAVIFECKALKNHEDAEEKCQDALKQIEEKRYAYELEEEGYQVIRKYGVVFRGKECMVRGKAVAEPPIKGPHTMNSFD